MESSLKTWVLRLLVVLPVLCLIISVVLWKHTQNEAYDIQTVKRELKADFEAEREKLRDEVDNIQHEKRQLRLEIENAQNAKKQLGSDLENLHVQKRDIQSQLETDKGKLQQQLKAFTDMTVSATREKRSANTGEGAMYVRWGRESCPSTSHKVYTGVAGGGLYTHSGAAANMLCMTHEPVWANYGNNANHYTFLYGTEYEVASNDFPLGHGNAEKLNNHDVPCTVCRSGTHSSVIMIPGTTVCEQGWTKEYSGYLMAGYYTHAAATEYNCIDADPDAHESGSTNDNGRLLYRVKGKCGSLPCPPYVDMREITCVVCTK